MLKSFKNIGFLLALIGCTPLENFVDGKIVVDKVSSLNPSVITEFTGKPLRLSGAQEIAKSPDQSIIKNDNNEFFLISNFHGEKKFFNMEKISVPSDRDIKSFFYLENKLYACIYNPGFLTIAECINKTSIGGDDVLPLIKFEFQDVVFFFPHLSNYLSDDFKKKIKPSLWMEMQASGGKYSDFDPTRLSFDLEDNIHCCSECVVGTGEKFHKGCFILAPCKVSYFSGRINFSINLGLFFDGEKIVPCAEIASDNSFYYGNFNNFIITSLTACGNKFACRGKEGKNNSDFVINGVLEIDSDNEVCYKLLSSHFVENLQNVFYLKTEAENSILTTISCDGSTNIVKIGRLTDSDFKFQTAPGIVGLDFFNTKAIGSKRTRLRNYNLCPIGGEFIMTQCKDNDNFTDHLITLNKTRLSAC